MLPGSSIVLVFWGTVVFCLGDAQLLLHSSPLVTFDPFAFDEVPSHLMGFVPMGNLRRARPTLDAEEFLGRPQPLQVAEIVGAAPIDYAQDLDNEEDGIGFALFQSVNPLVEQMSRLMEKMFNPFALLPDPFMELHGSRFEIPNVTLSDSDCLVTVDLEDDANQTAIRVYGAPNEIIIEVTKTTTFQEPGSDEPATGEEVQRAGDIPSSSGWFGLRGAQAISQFTAVRSFPAPLGCNMTAESSKATINKEKNQLLIKFPKIPGVVTPEETPTPAKGEPPTKNEPEGDPAASNQDGNTVLLRSALDVENVPSKKTLVKSTSSKGEPPAAGSSWWRSMFGGERSAPAAGHRNGMKVPVPIVRYDEF